MLEAFPQTLIQLYFLVKTSTINNVVIFSLLWSFFCIVSKTVTEDKFMFQEDYQNSNISLCSKKKCKNGKCISIKYLFRLLFRSIDITYRSFLFLLIWIFIGGFSIIVIVLIESLCLILLSFITNEFSSLFVFLPT